MFRIGLSGTNYTGKTETIRRFVQEHPELPIRVVSLSQFVTRCPFPMREEQTVEGSRWMVEQVRGTCVGMNGDIEIFDRTPVDVLAFTLYARDRTQDRAVTVIDNCLSLIRDFDRIFYLPPSDGWSAVVAAHNKDVLFARQMDTYIRTAVEEFGLEVVKLPWALDERQVVLSEYISAVVGPRNRSR